MLSPQPFRFTNLVRHAALMVSCALFLLPLAVMLSASLKTDDEIARDPQRLVPATWAWSNYPRALNELPFGTYLANTLVIAVGSVAGTLFSCILAAYAFARLRFRGRDMLFGLLIATMLLPFHATMIPRFVLISSLGLYNTFAAIVLPKFLGDAFSIFLLRQFFRSIPEELSEAARLDGAHEWTVLGRVVLPLSMPAIVTVGLFQFMAAWNDLNGPLLFLSDPQKFPLSYGLERFVSSFSTQPNLLMAAAVMFSLPLVLLFLVAQRYFVASFSSSGLK